MVAVSPASAQGEDFIPLDYSIDVLTVDEGDDISYSVNLTSQLDNEVIVHVSIQDFANSQIRFLDGGQEVSSLTLVIASSDYDDGVTVPVRALQNVYSGENREESILHTATSQGYANAYAILPVTVRDDEAPAVGLSVNMPLSRGLEGRTYRDILDLEVSLVDSNGEVVRMKEGTTEVTLEFSSEEVAEGYAFTFLGNSVTPDPNDPGVVTAQILSSLGTLSLQYDLLLIRDFLCERDETLIVTASAAGLESGTAIFTIMGHPDDANRCSFEIGEIAPVTEGGATTYTLALKSQQFARVTVAVSSTSDEIRLFPSSGSLVFTEMNWNIPQDIGVHTTDNEIGEGPRDVEITYVASGGAYDAFPFASTVTILDDEVASTRVDLSLSQYSGEEAFGAQGRINITVWVALDAAPRSEITTVTLSLLLNLEADGADIAVSFPNGDTIEIPAGETTGSIQVMLTLKNSNIVEENERFTILGSVVGGGLEDGTAIFTIIDNDVRGFGFQNYRVRRISRRPTYQNLRLIELSSQPTADVTLDFSAIVPGGGVADFLPTRMTFTTTGWYSSQYLTIL